jgi:ribosomal 30S subunit maturation factor RimM
LQEGINHHAIRHVAKAASVKSGEKVDVDSKKSEARPEERVTIGKIVGVHGVGGTMLILPLTDHPERFFSMKKLTLEKPAYRAGLSVSKKYFHMRARTPCSFRPGK